MKGENMKRYNDTNEGLIKEYKNGNLTIKLYSDTIAQIKSGRFSDIEVLSWIFDGLDTYFITDEYCLSNFDMGTTLYNAYSDTVYIISFTAIDNELLTGHTMRLYAHKPDAYDRETIEEYFND